MNKGVNVKMKILFTICGRAGSKGIKNKNIKDFLGKPLPLYSLSAIDLYLSKYTNVFADIVLNTDSEELMNIFRQNKMRKVHIIKRGPELSGDVVSKVAVIRDCVEKMYQQKSYQYDMVVDLDITSPLRTLEDLENLIEKKRTTNCDVVTSVVPSRRNPYFNMVKKGERGYEKVIKSDYVARQQAPEIFDLNASLYAYSVEFLFSGQNVLDGYCEVIEMYDTGVLDLDHENDFELMEVIADYLFKSKKEFDEIRTNIK